MHFKVKLNIVSCTSEMSDSVVAGCVSAKFNMILSPI